MISNRYAICVCTKRLWQHTDRYSRICTFSIICFLSVFLFSGVSSRDSFATDGCSYYVDASVEPGGDGSFSTPWNSIKQVNDYMRFGSFLPGDHICFKRGETFEHQQLWIRSSGEPGNPIIFEAYGDSTLPLPVIDGGMILNKNWTLEGGNIYSCPWDATPDDPTSLPLPNVLYYKGVPKRPITTLQFSSPVPLKLQPNAILLQLDNYYSTLLVTSTSATTNTVSGITSFIIGEDKDVYVRQVEYGLEKQWTTSLGTPKIISSKEGLAEPGHWYWDAGRLYLYADASPNNNSSVAVGFKDYGILIISDYVTIQDIKIQNTNGQGIYLTGSSGAKVQRVTIFGGGAFTPSDIIKRKNGIQLINCSGCTIRNNIVNSVVTAGITVYAYPGSASSNNVILNNTVTKIGGAGISLSSTGVSGNKIIGNNISKANALSYDGAGVYTFDAGPDNIIQSNTIHDCGSSYLRSAGIMVDNASAPVTITSNTIENNSKGGIVVSGAGHQITNNMLCNNGVSSWTNAEVVFFNSTTVASGCTVTGNTMEVDQNHHFIYVDPGDATGHTIDYNTYIYRGPSTTAHFYWPYAWMNFETWKSLTHHDTHSTLTKLPDGFLPSIHLLLLGTELTP